MHWISDVIEAWKTIVILLTSLNRKFNKPLEGSFSDENTALNTPLLMLDISWKCMNALFLAEIYKVKDVLAWSNDQLLKIPGFDQECLDELTKALDKLKE